MHLIKSHSHDSREIKMDDDDNFVIIMRCYFLLHLLCKNFEIKYFQCCYLKIYRVVNEKKYMTIQKSLLKNIQHQVLMW